MCSPGNLAGAVAAAMTVDTRLLPSATLGFSTPSCCCAIASSAVLSSTCQAGCYECSIQPGRKHAKIVLLRYRIQRCGVQRLRTERQVHSCMFICLW